MVTRGASMTSAAGRQGMDAMDGRMPSGSRQARRDVRAAVRGFAYVMLLLGIAVLALGASAALQLGAESGRRHAEQALLFVGGEFERALYSYAGVPVAAPGPGVQGASLMARGPRTLDELLKDPRVPGVRRHLRQLYVDPMTGKPEWGIVRDPAGFIIGIYSLAEGQPVKQMGFPARQAHFEEATGYAQWVFGLPMAQLQTMQKPAVPAAPVASK